MTQKETLKIELAEKTLQLSKLEKQRLANQQALAAQAAAEQNPLRQRINEIATVLEELEK